jgi:nucleotide-binding universal stress UspA family protein
MDWRATDVRESQCNSLRRAITGSQIVIFHLCVKVARFGPRKQNRLRTEAMKVLLPIDASRASLDAVRHVCSIRRRGTDIKAVVLNVQPYFNRHIARFSRRAARDSLRAARSRAAVAQAIDELALARVPFRLIVEVGSPAARIADVAAREHVDEIVMGVGRHPEWLRWLNPSISRGVMARTDIPVTVLNRGRVGLIERYAVPAGAASLAALFMAAE